MRLPIYTDEDLYVGNFYTTIDVNNNFVPVNEIVQLVNESGQVRATAKVTSTDEIKFDHISSSTLKRAASSHLRSWTNAAGYFLAKFPGQFNYAAPVQLVTFEVQSTQKFDAPLIESVQDDEELQLPTDEEMGINDEDESKVGYTVNSEE